MNTDNITKGKVFIEYVSKIPIGVNAEIITKRGSTYRVIIVRPILPDTDDLWELEKEETTANLELICEAFNVAQETGLSPIQMKERIKELEEERQTYKNCFERFIPIENWDEANLFLSGSGSGLSEALSKK